MLKVALLGKASLAGRNNFLQITDLMLLLIACGVLLIAEAGVTIHPRPRPRGCQVTRTVLQVSGTGMVNGRPSAVTRSAIGLYGPFLSIVGLTLAERRSINTIVFHRLAVPWRGVVQSR